MNNIKQALESAIKAFEDAHEEYGIWYRAALEQCKAALIEKE